MVDIAVFMMVLQKLKCGYLVSQKNSYNTRYIESLYTCM